MGKRVGVRRDWSQVLSEQSSSGLSVPAYCAQQGIGVSLFYQWRRRLSGSGVATEDGFVQLRPLASGASQSSGVSLVSPSGWRVELTAGFDAATLARVWSCVAATPPCWG